MGGFRLFTSTLAREEIDGGPDNVRRLFVETFDALLEINDEMADLADAYLTQGVVTSRYRSDALHVAACTVTQLDFLVSWNFKHLVNVSQEAAFNGVNLLRGYRPVRIVNPLELIYGNESKDI